MGYKSLWDSPLPLALLSTLLLKTLFLKNTKCIFSSGTSGLHYPCLGLSLRYSHRSASPFFLMTASLTSLFKIVITQSLLSFTFLHGTSLLLMWWVMYSFCLSPHLECSRRDLSVLSTDVAPCSSAWCSKFDFWWAISRNSGYWSHY